MKNAAAKRRLTSGATASKNIPPGEILNSNSSFMENDDEVSTDEISQKQPKIDKIERNSRPINIKSDEIVSFY